MTTITIKCNRFLRGSSYEKTGYEIELNAEFELTVDDHQKINKALSDIRSIFDPLIEKKVQNVKAEKEKTKEK